MNTLGDRIKKRRINMGLSQQQLADIVGYSSKTTICRFESNNENTIRNVKLSKINEIANALKTSVAYLMGWTENEGNTVTVPILTPAAAGLGKYADNEIIGYETIPSEWVNPYDEYRLIQVDGDSMCPKFEDKDYVLVRKQEVVDSGSYAVVLIDNEESVIKKITYGDGWVELISCNPKYEPRRFEGSEVQRITIFGLVKRIIRIC